MHFVYCKLVLNSFVFLCKTTQQHFYWHVSQFCNFTRKLPTILSILNVMTFTPYFVPHILKSPT